MCGRARCTLRADDIPRACHVTGRPLRSINTDRYRPSYNVAPGRDIPVVRREDGSYGDGVVLQSMKWGLIPSFTKKTEKPDHYKMFNARSESVGEKASFRRLIPNNRCLVAVEGFYEWKKNGSKKQPYYIHMKDGQPFVFAALYDSWKTSEGEILYTFTILTTLSSSALEWLHDRMPVILGDEKSTDAWLNGSSSFNFESLLKPYQSTDLVWYPVTPLIGKPSFDEPDCVKEIKLKSEEINPISKFFAKKTINNEEDNHEEEEEEKPKVEIEVEDQANISEPQSLKEEPRSLDQENYEEKPYISPLEGKKATYTPIKRDYEEFSAETKQSKTEAKLHTQANPPKKNGNTASAGDKQQPTLFSYFNKK